MLAGSTPRQLRDRAASIRWVAEGMQGEARAHELQQFADELDAQAERLEAEMHRRSRRSG
ncbi:MAG TPA: hypothetical protein VHY82_01325 [Acetobacteraceae bacterium]|nr:hypothetical protein [Acetobacteraceae bacterium]